MKFTADLMEQIRRRVGNPATIHDFADWLKPSLLPKATAAEISAAEQAMQLELPDDYKTLLLNIANGGFGPGYGLIGVGSGYGNLGGGNLETVYRLAHSSGIKGRFVVEEDRVVPFCNWGCGIYSCLDCRSSKESKVLLYNPKVDLLSTDNLKSVEVRDSAGDVKLQVKIDWLGPKPKSKSVPLTPHRGSFLDFMTAWANGERLWDEIMRLSGPTSSS